VCKNRRLDGEEAVIAGAGPGGKAVGYFFLDEEDGADEIEAKDLFDDGRGDVVREVAGDDGASPLGEVGREDIGVDELERGEAGAEVVGEIGVQLDRNQAIRTGDQLLGKGAAAGSDFNDQRFVRRARSRSDAFEDRTLDEEVLAEALGH
jgi:hypothetical protein